MLSSASTKSPTLYVWTDASTAEAHHETSATRSAETQDIRIRQFLIERTDHLNCRPVAQRPLSTAPDTVFLTTINLTKNAPEDKKIWGTLIIIGENLSRPVPRRQILPGSRQRQWNQYKQFRRDPDHFRTATSCGATLAYCDRFAGWQGEAALGRAFASCCRN